MTTAREIQALPPDIRADVEERAAIMEFDGGLTREEAERAALAAGKNGRQQKGVRCRQK